jgi:hypothetical protein
MAQALNVEMARGRRVKGRIEALRSCAMNASHLTFV